MSNIDALEKSRQDILSSPAKFRAHMDMMENAFKLRIVDEMRHWMEDYDQIVETSEDPDVRLKHLRAKMDLAGWGPSAKKVENPQDRLPVFHITINRATDAVKITSRTEDIVDAEDVMDLGDIRPTPQMLLTLGVNADIEVLDA